MVLLDLNHEIDELIASFKNISSKGKDVVLPLSKTTPLQFSRTAFHVNPKTVLRNEEKLAARLLPYDQNNNIERLRNYRNQTGEYKFSKNTRQLKKFDHKLDSIIPEPEVNNTYNSISRKNKESDYDITKLLNIYDLPKSAIEYYRKNSYDIH